MDDALLVDAMLRAPIFPVVTAADECDTRVASDAIPFLPVTVAEDA